MICSNCNGVNDKNNKYCSLCGAALIENQSEIKSVKDDYEDGFVDIPAKKARLGCFAISTIWFYPFLFIGIILIVISIYDYFVIVLPYKDYVETTGYFIEYVACHEEEFEGELETVCYEKYEYEVNDKKYTNITKDSHIMAVNEEDLPKTVLILYDPNDPSKSTVKYHYDLIFLIVGIVLVSVFATVAIVTYIIIRKLIKKDGDVKMFVSSNLNE